MLEGLIIALISGLAGHFLPRGWKKWKLKKTFVYLQGEWAHFSKDHEHIQGGITTLTYTSEGKLEVQSTTKYGNWHGEIEMVRSMPKKGIGYFKYDEKDEGGDLEIFVNSNDEIWVYPRTHTHKLQKTDFYIWEREFKSENPVKKRWLVWTGGHRATPKGQTSEMQNDVAPKPIDPQCRDELIEHLSREIDRQTSDLMTFHSRMGFTVLVGPLLLIGAFLVATEGRVAINWKALRDPLSILASISLICSYFGLGYYGGKLAQHMAEQCDIWRGDILKLAQGGKSSLKESDIKFERNMISTYLWGWFIILITFVSILILLAKLYVLPDG